MTRLATRGLVGMYLKDSTSYHRDTCPPMFITVIFMNWNRPRCPSRDEWMMKMWHIHTMKYYLARKTSEIYKKMDRFGKYNIKPSNQNTKRQKLHILPMCVNTSL